MSRLRVFFDDVGPYFGISKKTFFIGFGIAAILSELIMELYFTNHHFSSTPKKKKKILKIEEMTFTEEEINSSSSKNSNNKRLMKHKGSHPSRLMASPHDDDGKGRLIPREVGWYRWQKCNPEFWKAPEHELWNTVLFFPEIFPDQEGSQTQQMIWYMKQAKKTLKIALYISSFRPLEAAVFDMVQKGVRVTAVTNTPRNVPVWRRKGVNIREKPKIAKSPHSTSTTVLYVDHMHNKFIIVDDKAVLTGSLNWTRSAVIENRENVMITNHESTVKKFVAEFDKLWKMSEPPKKERKL